MSDMLLTKILCRYDPAKILDIRTSIAEEFHRNRRVFEKLSPGARIAVAVGSRGISNLQIIVRSVVDELRSIGAMPFVIPAMGSHGGATAEGQASILAEYGITEEAVGAPIRSSMQTIELPSTGTGTRVFMSTDAWESDGVVLVNRIKAHTDFHGEFESGLLKMAVIGLGKHAQALEIHGYGVRGLRELIGPVARTIIGTGKILCGLGIVENAYDDTALLRLIPSREIPAEEPLLLARSKELMPRLPVSPLDLLIVDELGKNISGVGMDPNIIGRMRVRGQEEPSYPRISSIAVFDLTSESHGNALGIGLADVTTRSVFDKIDYGATLANAITSSFLDRAKIPLIAENPRQAIEIALRAASVRDFPSARIMRIQNTLRLGEIFVSEALLPELSSCEGVEILSDRVPLLKGDGLFHA